MKGPRVKPATTAISFEDAELVERCRQGDMAAFGRLVVMYQDRVFNTCWRMCGNRADAEDLTQEAFVRALQSIDRFSGQSRFYTWVFRIAVNLVLSARRRSKHAARQSLDAPRAEDDTSTTMAARLQASEDAPVEQVGDREQEARVMRALGELDEEHRAVVILRDLESLAYDEIAEVLDIPAGTVKSRLHRARLALRASLSPILGMAERP